MVESLVDIALPTEDVLVEGAGGGSSPAPKKKGRAGAKKKAPAKKKAGAKKVAARKAPGRKIVAKKAPGKKKKARAR